MMKRVRIWIVLFAIAAPMNGSSQDLVLAHSITEDSISIKWIPSDFEQYKLISNGAKVSRIESSELQNYQSLDFKNAIIWEIEPVKTRYENLDPLVDGNEKMSALLDPLFEKKGSAELENFAFGTALIENIVNPSFQFVLGNIVVDKSFKKNKTYVYKIEVAGFETAFITINTKKQTVYSSINDLELSLDAKKTVDLEWMAKRYEKEAFGFQIEHSIDEIQEGNYLTETPFLPFTSDQQVSGTKTQYRDTPEPGHFHFYRLHGLNLFGHPSLVSEWKKIYVPLLINAVVSIDTVYANHTQRHINGTVHNSEKAHLLHTSLLRSKERGGNYERIQRIDFKDSIVQFTINEPKTGDHFYYKIMLSNKDDSVFSVPRYLFTLDQEAPDPPTNLAGTIDSNGVVSLSWDQPQDHDILGYRVFRANTKKEEFIEKTTELKMELLFHDTLPLDNLTSEVYYSLQTVDLNYNQSNQSDTLLLLKPDTIAPIPAVLKNVLQADKRLKISWTNSDSDDVKENSLIRTSAQGRETVLVWTDTVSGFVDTNIVPGSNYEYEIVTRDESLNASNSGRFSKYYEPGYRNELAGFKAEVDLSKKLIVLSWEAPDDDVFSYQIFRGKEGEKVLPLKTLSGDGVFRFEDRNVRINNKYVYTVKYVNLEGIHSLVVGVEVVYQ